MSGRLGLASDTGLFSMDYVEGELARCEAAGLHNVARAWREQRTWLRKQDSVPPSTKIRPSRIANISNLRLAKRQRYLRETAHTFAMEADGRRMLRDRAREMVTVEGEMRLRGLPLWPHE